MKHCDALCKMIFSKLAGQKLLVSEPSPLTDSFSALISRPHHNGYLDRSLYAHRISADKPLIKTLACAIALLIFDSEYFS